MFMKLTKENYGLKYRRSKCLMIHQKEDNNKNGERFFATLTGYLVLTHSLNRCASDFASLRPNSVFGGTSDTPQLLSEMPAVVLERFKI